MSVPRKKHKSGQTTDSESVCAKCIIHNDDCKSDTIILLSELSDPEGRFQKILDVCKRRLDQPTHSAQRKTNICEQVPAK